MNNKIKDRFCIVLFSTSLFSSFAIAGGMDSGGGHSIVCFENANEAEYVKSNNSFVPDHLLTKISSVEFLDYYYAKVPIGMSAMTVALIDESSFQNGVEIYDFIKNRLSTELPELYDIIDNSERSFDKTGISWAPIGDEPLHDTGMLDTITDNRCVMVLMAYQQTSGQINYLQIDNRLYNHAANSKLSQASMFLHEFLYLQARKAGKVDSSSVLMIVRQLLRKELNVAHVRALSEKLKLF